MRIRDSRFIPICVIRETTVADRSIFSLGEQSIYFYSNETEIIRSRNYKLQNELTNENIK